MKTLVQKLFAVTIVSLIATTHSHAGLKNGGIQRQGQP